MKNTINLEEEITRENDVVIAAEKATEQKHLDEQAKLDREVEKVLETADATYRVGIMAELGFDYKIAEAQKIRKERDQFAQLPQNRIMTLPAIKTTCIKYGLRFLPTRYYKGSLDAGIGPRLEDFRKLMGGELPVVSDAEVIHDKSASYGNQNKTQMYIAAPAESFALQPMPRDPLLFCRLNTNKFYLLHKWGNDLERADIKDHGVTERNWNSIFSETRESLTDFTANLWRDQVAAVAGSRVLMTGLSSGSITLASGNSLNSQFLGQSQMGQWMGVTGNLT